MGISSYYHETILGKSSFYWWITVEDVSLLLYCFKNKEGYPAIVYIHPWEFDMEQPHIDLPLSRRFMHYFNIKVTPKKVEGLLQHFQFSTVKDVLRRTT